MTFAHVGGVPLEEALLSLTSGASAALLLARAWIASRVPSTGSLSGAGSDAAQR